MRVLIASDSFKGSLTALEANRIIADGWRAVRKQDHIDLVPLADGGEGTAEIIAGAYPFAERREMKAVTGPDGRKIDATWYLLPDMTAVLDLAETSGLPLMRSKDSMRATTRGLGEVLRTALCEGAHDIWLGLGGSATSDGGLGALRALGVKALDRNGQPVPEGGRGLKDLVRIDHIDKIPVPGEMLLLTDVTNPLTGNIGAAHVYGPQKGASLTEVALLDQGLTQLSRVIKRDPNLPGMGAAGGAAYGFVGIYGARVVSGAEFIFNLYDLRTRIKSADLVITGEGMYDEQSAQGKVTGRVIDISHVLGTDCAIIAGQVNTRTSTLYASIIEAAGSLSRAMEHPKYWLFETARSLAIKYARSMNLK